MRLFLVRHGQTAWNVEGRAQGHTDIPLDEEGMRQARIVGEVFAGVPLRRVISSDLRRSLNTAAPIASAAGAQLVSDSRLRERGFGGMEGRPFTELHQSAPSVESSTFLTYRPPGGGESFQDVWDRLASFVDELAVIEGDTAVVSHGGTTAILLAKLLRGTVFTSRAFRFGNAAIVELERRPDGFFTMLRYNDTAHLRSNALTGDLDGAHR